MLSWLAVGALLVGCSTDRPAVRKAHAEAEAKLHPGRSAAPPESMPEAWPVPRARQGVEPPDGAPRTIVLVVQDGLRADRMPWCGGGGQHTPHAASLAAHASARLHCGVISPATWSLPAHASLLTGQLPEGHGLLQVGDRAAPGVDTLAERMRARGYRTVWLSANPAMLSDTGLHRGFEVVEVADRWGTALRGAKMARRLGLRVAEAGRAPLFVVVTLANTRSPFAAIGRGHPVLAPRGPLRLFPRRNPAHPSWRVARGERSGPSFERWRTSLRDSYAYGVELNDAQLGDIVKSLVQADRHRDLRMGVVGSHGAPLGEDGWLAWAGPPTEGAARVPLLWIDTTSQDDPLRAPWVSSADLASLLEGGRLPDPPTTPRAWTLGAEGASPAPSDDAPGITWWGEVGAVRWREGEPVPPRWAGDVEAWRDARSRMADAPVDDALAEALRALGYGEP